jgi:hypothetical protein
MKKRCDDILFCRKRNEISRLSIRISPTWKNSEFLISVKRMQFRVNLSDYFLMLQLHLIHETIAHKKRS